MAQKVHPIASRLGIIFGWESIWVGNKKTFGEYLKEDMEIRKYVKLRLAQANVSHVYIERTAMLVTVTVTAGRPGLIIGKSGQDVDRLKEELSKMTGKNIHINIFEVKRPDTDATLVAKNICQQIENRISYKRAIKSALESAIRSGVEGIKIQISGRLNGVEMARTETYKKGRMPLATLRADIDYALETAQSVGTLGVKVWIMKGEVYGRRELSPLFGLMKKPNTKQ